MDSAFITEDFDASQWVNIEPYANALLSRELNCSGCLETLIKDGSTLAEHVSEAGTLLSIATVSYTHLTLPTTPYV